MIYKDEFIKINKNIKYHINDKMYYRTKAFKICPFDNSEKLIQEIFDVPKKPHWISFSEFKPKPEFKNIFRTEKSIQEFVYKVRYGAYVENEKHVIAYLTTIAFIFDKIDTNKKITTQIRIYGPKDSNHLDELKGLKNNKKTEISGIKLKEVLRSPTHAGYKYKLHGQYHFQTVPKDFAALKDEIKSFIEMFGGTDNDNVKFTGGIKTILDYNGFNPQNIYPIRQILRGFRSLTFTLHYKDHGELMSLNFMKNNVSVISAVEFMK
jgi:hypothetical protein